MADFEEIKNNATLRVVKDHYGFTIQYINPGEKDWKSFETTMSPQHTMNRAKEISIIIHPVPKTKFTIEGYDLPDPEKIKKMPKFENGEGGDAWS